MLTAGLLASAVAASFFGVARAQACETQTVTSNVPASGTGVKLQSYSYCGGTLNVTAYIENVNYDKIVTLYYTNADGNVTPLSAVQLGYGSDAGNNYENWFASTPEVNLDGITQFVNITYQATDIGKNYVDTLNLPVKASGAAPTTSTIPAPYATPTGFADDITAYLAAKNGSEAATAKSLMFKNIEIPNSANGTIIAAQSYSAPDYAYTWVRDSSLTMDVVQMLYAASEGSNRDYYAEIFFAYAAARAVQQQDKNLQTGLGEPKFNLDNTVFTGPWGRPQNDGPATAAITFINFANNYLSFGGDINTIRDNVYDSTGNPNQSPVKTDLLFVANNWTSPSFDLWEEEEGNHFYTRMVQHRAMVLGKDFATKMGDSETSSTCSKAASDIANSLPQFWDDIRSLILYEYGPVLHNKYSYKDIAVVLGIQHGYAGDGLYAWTDDKVLRSALQITTSFIPVYSISSTTKDSDGNVLGIPTGRYPEDVYDGVENSVGNPWFLATSSMAELMYRAHVDFTKAGSLTISNTSLPFWNYFAPAAGPWSAGQTVTSSDAAFKGAMDALAGWGDAYMRTVKYYGSSNGGHLPEEYNRGSGQPTGAADLTWSYGAVLTAAIARADAMGDTGYAGTLASMYTPVGRDA